METLYEIPTKITAGTTVSYTRTPPDFPASDGWTLTLYLNGTSTTASKAGVASGDSHVITLSGTETGALAAGDYRYSEVATKTTSAYEYARGTVTVLPTLVSAAAGAARTENEILLAAWKAARAALSDPTIRSYTIDGRTLDRRNLSEIDAAIARLKYAVWREQNPDKYLTDVEINYPESRS